MSLHQSVNVAARYLAFDLGAESGRAMLGFLSDDDRLTLSELHRFPNRVETIEGHLHWDVPRLLNEIYEGMRCSARDRDPRSIGIDTWGVDFCLLKKGEPISLPYTYRDRRTEGAVKGFLKRMPLERLYELTGTQILPFNTLFQLYSMSKNNSVELRSASDLLMIADLFNYRLTGVKISEFTLATTTQMYNPRKRRWEQEIINTLEMPESLMREVIQPGGYIGELTEDTRRRTGLGRIPVSAVACHDTGSAVASIPAKEPDFAYISSGTWSLMGIETREPLITAKTLSYNLTNEGGVSGTFRVLKNIAGLWLLQECKKVWSKDHDYSYDELISLGKKAESLKSLVDPDWAGFLNPDSMPEAISYFCAATSQRIPCSIGEYVRVILESLALAYRHTLSQLEDVSGRRLSRIHIVGGGSRNTLLCQLTCDATGREVFAGPVEATAIGNILVQAMTDSRIKDLNELRRIVRNSFRIELYEPREGVDWDSAYERFLAFKKQKVKVG